MSAPLQDQFGNYEIDFVSGAEHAPIVAPGTGDSLAGHGAPSSSSTAGSTYFDLDTSNFYVYTGSSWALLID